MILELIKDHNDIIPRYNELMIFSSSPFHFNVNFNEDTETEPPLKNSFELTVFVLILDRSGVPSGPMTKYISGK